MADWAKSVRQEVEQEVEQSLVCHQLLCLPYQLCSNQLLKLTKHRISAIKGKKTGSFSNDDSDGNQDIKKQ